MIAFSTKRRKGSSTSSPLRSRIPASSRMLIAMREPISLCCPYCGESVDLNIDENGGSQQSYVEDCPVCCRPWQVELMRDREGRWSATLQMADE